MSRSLKEIALDLLDKYQFAELEGIGEMSSDIELSEKNLDEEVGAIKAEIENTDCVQVVRCKDCKYWRVDDDANDKGCPYYYTDEEGYCCDGERKEEV